MTVNRTILLVKPLDVVFHVAVQSTGKVTPRYVEVIEHILKFQISLTFSIPLMSFFVPLRHTASYKYKQHWFFYIRPILLDLLPEWNFTHLSFWLNSFKQESNSKGNCFQKI